LETDLSHLNLNRKVTSPNGTLIPANIGGGANSHFSNGNSRIILTIPPLPRLPTNPSRVDRLIFDYTREYGRLVGLISKIDNLKNTIFYEGILLTLQKWLNGINNVQARRKDELINNAQKQRLGQSVPTGVNGRISDEKGKLLFLILAKNLC
jgi:hypothetical protein